MTNLLTLDEIAVQSIALSGTYNPHLPFPFWHTSGVYFLLVGGAIVYVGQSIHANRRLFEHLRAGEVAFDACFSIPCDRQDLDTMERNYIRAFNPKFNRDITTRKMRGLRAVTFGQKRPRGRPLPFRYLREDEIEA